MSEGKPTLDRIEALLVAIADLGRYEYEHPATGGLAARLGVVFDLAGELRDAIRDADTAVPESGYDHLIEQDARGVSCCVEHAAEAAALTAVPDSRETLA